MKTNSGINGGGNVDFDEAPTVDIANGGNHRVVEFDESVSASGRLIRIRESPGFLPLRYFPFSTASTITSNDNTAP
jgi:hypothetical protein